jgi:diguanylate cyclase (GGDEF)-like protein
VSRRDEIRRPQAAGERPPGPPVRWLLLLVQRLGWRIATVLALALVVSVAVVVTGLLDLAIHGLLPVLLTAAIVSLVVALPGLGVTLRLVDHLARTRGLLQHEIERRCQAEIRLRKLVTADQLTGLANRRSFLARARTALRIARRYGQPLSLLLIDVDHFKQVNDRHGHQAGDRALQRMARILESELRESDTAGRIGGDEFVALLPQTDAESAACAAERIRAAVARQTEPPFFTVAIGVAEARPGGTEQLNDLLRAADQALYQAKEGGRDRVRTARAPPPTRRAPAPAAL